MRVVLFFLFITLLWAGFASAGETCCVCRYQQNDPFSWLFQQQCQNWLAEPDQRLRCDHTSITPITYPMGASCKYELPDACRGATGTLIDKYYGHFGPDSTRTYLDQLVSVCIDESCNVYSVNTGCSVLSPSRDLDSMPEFIQKHLNSQNLPEGVHFTFTGSQCTSAGREGEGDDGFFPCANADCTLTFGCEPEFVSCDRLGEGVCLDPGETVRCTNVNGETEYRYCCAQGAFIPGFGRWRKGTSCDDLPHYPCLRGCCTCGSDPQTGAPCKYCEDTAQFGDDLPLPGSKATIKFTKYKEILKCENGNCRMVCETDNTFWRTNPPITARKTAICGEWWISLPGDQSNGIKRDCSTGGFTYRVSWLDSHGWTDGSQFGGVQRGFTEGDCSPEDVAFYQQAAQRYIQPAPEASCTSYVVKEWCGGMQVPTVEITIATKNTDMCS